VTEWCIGWESKFQLLVGEKGGKRKVGDRLFGRNRPKEYPVSAGLRRRGWCGHSCGAEGSGAWENLRGGGKSKGRSGETGKNRGSGGHANARNNGRLSTGGRGGAKNQNECEEN